MIKVMVLMVMMVIVSGERREEQDNGNDPLTSVRPCRAPAAGAGCAGPAPCPGSKISWKPLIPNTDALHRAQSFTVGEDIAANDDYA